VIDHHHPIRDGLDAVEFLEIRTEMGATSSIIYQYLEAAGIEIESRLATAIFYGIQTDTQGLSRGGSQIDQDIYLTLVNRIDRQKLIQVMQAGLPRDYFQAFSDGLKATWIYGGAVFTFLDELHRPDFVAEMADSLVRLENVKAVLCTGHHEGVLYLSLRTRTSKPDAGLMIQRIITPYGKAGGHGTMAGGQIRVGDKPPMQIANDVRARFLEVMGESGDGDRLLS
jgi:nanoRNase/pAp phosphatase (c-di-AMP/oligoRNAs hydrolase)